MDNLKKLKSKLKELGITDVEFTKHKPIFSVEEGLKELGIDVSQGVSTLIFKTDKGYVGVYRRDDRKVDSGKVKKFLKVKKLELCSPEEIEKEFGFTAGAVGVYHEKLEYVMDLSLMEKDYLYGGVGDPTGDIKIKPKDLQKLSGAKALECTSPSERSSGGSKKKRILTGDTPSGSGRLHLGHYVGSLENRVKLQDEYDLYVILANIHAYANYYDKAEMINESAYQTFLDNLAVGIDPERSTIFLESGIPELYELYGFFLTMVKHARAMRNPSVKEEVVYKKIDPSLGFIAYPILQAADILGFNADLVPVGEDQLPVVEQVREIAKDFNKAYGKTFVVPEGKVGRIARLVGTDGKLKMSKSGSNSILLSDDEETLKKKVMSIYTDPNRIHSTDPGKVEGNVVFIYHDAFNPDEEEVQDLKERYKKGEVGDVKVKEKLFRALDDFLKPMRERRKYYEEKPNEAKEILNEGTKRARRVVQKVVADFRGKVGINKLVE